MRFLTNRPPNSRRSHLVRVTRDAAIVVSAAAIVLAGAACSGASKQATPTPATAPQTAGAAKQAAEALKTQLTPLNAPVPLPLPKLDGLAVSMTPVLPALKALNVNSAVRDLPIAIGAIAVPPFSVNLSLGAPSLSSLAPGLGVPPMAIPTMPPS
ncbi:MAG: hypothetical protein O2822_07115, partial [Chloroflexi bacterium]|nr:hypothetical protein [Chloroflexota bacterium]